MKENFVSKTHTQSAIKSQYARLLVLLPFYFTPFFYFNFSIENALAYKLPKIFIGFSEDGKRASRSGAIDL
jgi:hypothetical protein